jgi:dTDP-4-dehydrorhamnose reductase
MDKQYCNPEIWGGIECTINRVNDNFFDQLACAGHYVRPGDIDLIADLGIKKIRYPILWEKHCPELEKPIDWKWIDGQLSSIRKHNIDVIAGLLHHGSGPSYTHMLDPHFPLHLARYARAVAEKFPWIEYYTPVNEPLTTSRFSGLYGLWYPHLKDPKAFMQMLLNELKGTVLAMKAIRDVNPNAKLVQTEDLGKTYSTAKLKYQADFENERRWLTYDLLCGRVDRHHSLWPYFKYIGLDEKEILFFRDHPCLPDYFGFNHYITSERYLDERLELYPPHSHGGNGWHAYADVEAVRVELEEETGIKVLLKEAWERFQQPMAITEVHLHCHREEQLRWFTYVWDACKELKNEGVDIRAVTAWAILGSYGWNKLLTEQNGDYEPGVFDLRGEQPRPTALARFIKGIHEKERNSHPLTGIKGWWLRHDRFFHATRPSKILSAYHKKTAPVLILGKSGTLGKAFARVCEDRCIHYILVGRPEVDIRSVSSIRNAIERYKPWAVINAAGYVRVDDAESEPEACFQSNTDGAANLSILCKEYGIKFITYSSDLVFDGRKEGAYLESDPTSALNVYGMSKVQAEERVMQENPSSLIIRTSAFFSQWDEYNFVHHVHKNLSIGDPVTAASDLIISPTFVPDLVNSSLDLLVDDETGIWHLANQGSITWADLALEIASLFDLDAKLIKPLPVKEMNLAARRPANSALSSERGCLLPTLEDALRRYMDHKEFQDQVA